MRNSLAIFVFYFSFARKMQLKNERNSNRRVFAHYCLANDSTDNNMVIIFLTFKVLSKQMFLKLLI